MIEHELKYKSVYPGHPIIVAICIIHVYKKASDALAITDHGWCHALGSRFVPGDGNCARAGADVIKMLQEGKTTDEAIDFANDYWLKHVNPNGKILPKQWKPGQEQADKNLDLFKQMVANWDFS